MVGMELQRLYKASKIRGFPGTLFKYPSAAATPTAFLSMQGALSSLVQALRLVLLVLLFFL